MDIVIKSLGIVFVLIGFVFLLRPDIMKWLIEFIKKGKRVYFAGLIRLALAVVFFSSFRECDKPWFIFAFGVLFLIAGILIFMLGPEKIRRVLDWYQKQSVLCLRAIAVLPMVLGALIIYSA